MRLHAYMTFLSLNLADLVSRSYIKSPSNVREKEICCFKLLAQKFGTVAGEGSQIQQASLNHSTCTGGSQQLPASRQNPVLWTEERRNVALKQCKAPVR